eukprot:6019183-Amphidinium_carterae.1
MAVPGEFGKVASPFEGRLEAQVMRLGNNPQELSGWEFSTAPRPSPTNSQSGSQGQLDAIIGRAAADSTPRCNWQKKSVRVQHSKFADPATGLRLASVLHPSFVFAGTTLRAEQAHLLQSLEQLNSEFDLCVDCNAATEQLVACRPITWGVWLARVQPEQLQVGLCPLVLSSML